MPSLMSCLVFIIHSFFHPFKIHLFNSLGGGLPTLEGQVNVSPSAIPATVQGAQGGQALGRVGKVARAVRAVRARAVVNGARGAKGGRQS